MELECSLALEPQEPRKRKENGGVVAADLGHVAVGVVASTGAVQMLVPGPWPSRVAPLVAVEVVVGPSPLLLLLSDDDDASAGAGGAGASVEGAAAVPLLASLASSPNMSEGHK